MTQARNVSRSNHFCGVCRHRWLEPPSFQMPPAKGIVTSLMPGLRANARIRHCEVQGSCDPKYWTIIAELQVPVLSCPTAPLSFIKLCSCMCSIRIFRSSLRQHPLLRQLPSTRPASNLVCSVASSDGRREPAGGSRVPQTFTML